MAAQREQHGQDGPRHEPPFLLPLIQEQTQHEEEDRDGAQVHRPRREGLRAPVERQVLGRFPEIRLAGPLEQVVGLRVLGIDRTGGRTAVEIGNQQVGEFLPAVGPGCGVIQVEAFGSFAALGGRRAAAAHGVRGVFHRGEELGGVGGDAGHAENQQKGRGSEESAPKGFLRDRLRGGTAEPVAAKERNDQDDYVDQDQDTQIVGDLRMVRLDLEAQRQAEERRAEDSAR